MGKHFTFVYITRIKINKNSNRHRHLIIFVNKKRTPSGKKYAIVDNTGEIKKPYDIYLYTHIRYVHTVQRTWLSRKAFYQLEKG